MANNVPFEFYMNQLYIKNKYHMYWKVMTQNYYWPDFSLCVNIPHISILNMWHPFAWRKYME
jgi:hypothetical protein